MYLKFEIITCTFIVRQRLTRPQANDTSLSLLKRKQYPESNHSSEPRIRLIHCRPRASFKLFVRTLRTSSGIFVYLRFEVFVRRITWRCFSLADLNAGCVCSGDNFFVKYRYLLQNLGLTSILYREVFNKPGKCIIVSNKVWKYE